MDALRDKNGVACALGSDLSNPDKTSPILVRDGVLLCEALGGDPFTVNWGDIGGSLINQVDLQNALNTKVDKITGKGLSTEDYTTTEKTKLSGIAENANNYVLPSDVVQDNNYVHTDNNYTTTEKNKLSGIEEGAEVNTLDGDATITNATVVSALPGTPDATTLYLILE